MYKFDYQLDIENIRELNDYLALHDKSIQKKMISLIISIMIIVLIVTILLFKLSFTSIVIMIIAFVLTILFLPKIYWKTIFDRIEKVTKENDLKFSHTEIQFGDEITIEQDNKKLILDYQDIQYIDFTKSNCMLFCKINDAVSKVIIPLDTIGNHIESFTTFLQKEIQHEK